MTNIRLVLVIAALVAGLGMAQTPPAPSTPTSPSLRSSLRAQEDLYLEAARYLGVTPQELVLLGRGGKTLSEIAKELGADSAKLETALVEARDRAIDQAVQRRGLTSEEATRYKAVSPAVVQALLNRPVGMGPVLEGLTAPRLRASNSLLRPRWIYPLPNTLRPFGWERQDGWWVW
jgi:hypothetical protein